MDDRKTQDKHQ